MHTRKKRNEINYIMHINAIGLNFILAKRVRSTWAKCLYFTFPYTDLHTFCVYEKRKICYADGKNDVNCM